MEWCAHCAVRLKQEWRDVYSRLDPRALCLLITRTAEITVSTHVSSKSPAIWAGIVHMLYISNWTILSQKYNSTNVCQLFLVLYTGFSNFVQTPLMWQFLISVIIYTPTCPRLLFVWIKKDRLFFFFFKTSFAQLLFYCFFFFYSKAPQYPQN